MAEDQTQFISVPVPSQHVTQVYAYLAELTGTATLPVSPVPSAGMSSTADSADDGKLPIVPWSVEEFRKLMIEPLGSVQTIARALDILAKQPDTRVSYTSLATQLGIEKKNLQGNLSAFTRTMHRRYKRRNWPMTWVEALTTEPGLKSEFFYTMTATVAERWLTARAHD